MDTPELDGGRCYEALLARDRRFDGRIFGGVVTTGVYCRPICPVRPAKRENVRWFACAAAAEAAGFRPCRRCRPEAAPGTPAWVGSSAVVSRALRLIASDAFEDGGIECLAARVGLGARQLRRLFAEHLGAAPAAIARARRVHFARTLLDDTSLPVTQVAFATGFRSVRQFNHSMRATFGAPPTALRRRSARRPLGADALVIRLAYRPPLDWEALVRFLAVRAIPGVEHVGPRAYRRTIDVGGVAAILEVRPDDTAGPWLTARVHRVDCDDLIGVAERVRRLFDLGADPLAIATQLRRCPTLRRHVDAAPGLRVPGAWDPFELAVRAVLGQQITVRGATTLAGRLVAAFGTPLAEPSDGLTHLFPRAATLAEADLARIGLPRARAATIRALAAAVAAGTLALDAARGLDDALARLCAIPGVGPWTAAYVAMRALGEPDALPAGDLGLRRAAAYGRGPLSAAALAELAEGWRPWRAYGAMHLWCGEPGAAAGAARKVGT